MRKKQRLVQVKPDETNIHPVGRERFVAVQRYTGDFPSGEPNDWFPQSDEYDEFLICDPRNNNKTEEVM